MAVKEDFFRSELRNCDRAQLVACSQLRFQPIKLGTEASLVWGVGPAFQFPTLTDDLLGTGKWSAGPGFVVFLSDERLHITTGFLILNLWSFAGDDNRADVNAMTLQPFLNYNPHHKSAYHRRLGG